jgi:hypothetical protein
VLERLDERLVGERAVLVAAPVQSARATRAGGADELGDHPRLADPGLAAEHDEPRLARHDGAEVLLEPAQLELAADEGPHRRAGRGERRLRRLERHRLAPALRRRRGQRRRLRQDLGLEGA